MHNETDMIEAAKGDPRCFGPLYERYFHEIFRFVRRRVNSMEHTADLTQQTFLKALLSLHTFNYRGIPFKAWLYRIALNEVRMYWRKRKEVLIEFDHPQAVALVDELGGPNGEEDLEPLTNALLRLHERQARLIELRYMDGLSYQEIAAIFGITEDAAKMRTHRVLALLRTYLSRP
jgi:RNA polymerase sigma-70 factor, ECF subfamily